jgi:hypothetical protein
MHSDAGSAAGQRQPVVCGRRHDAGELTAFFVAQRLEDRRGKKAGPYQRTFHGQISCIG